MGDEIGCRHQLSMTSFEAFELEITVNYPMHTWMENSSFVRNLMNWSVLFLFFLLTKHKVLHCYVTNAVYHCLVAGQLYLSCGFASADCWCFQVSNPCRAIHSTVSVHHTALTDSDFLTRMSSSCEIFVILFNFYWSINQSISQFLEWPK